jgi:hypothetical protein
MKKHERKMAAPIGITVLIVAYYAVFFGVLMRVTGGLARVLLGIVPLALAAVMIYVCVQRIQEIRSGEEDDLSKY